MEERKTITLGQLSKSFEDVLLHPATAEINLHNKKSFSKDTVYSTMQLPLDKALKIFGDVEILYSQLSSHIEKTEFGEYSYPSVKFGIVVK